VPAVGNPAKAPGAASKGKRRTQVSAETYRRQVKNILHSLDGYRMSEAYWMMGGMVKRLEEIADSADAFLESGDAEGALTILMTILEEVADGYDQLTVW
jgi:NADH:ubiquinone oxidoreductase subunit D